MPSKAVVLTSRDYFLLGWLANALDGRGSLPKGCTEAQARRLARAGYLQRITMFAMDGQEIVRYQATRKGQAVWHTYGFTTP